VGVVTSILGYLAKRDLLRLGFPVEKFFILQGADDASAYKPDPKVFDGSLKRLKGKGIMPGDVVYIGDALMDYYAARDAGINFIGVTTGSISKEQFKKEGAKSVSTLTDLSKMLKVSNSSI
jgi:phosphoglycolate phosphatase-like HAD superfamily hydrolase